MKYFLLLILCSINFGLFAQATVDGRWHVECGASTASFQNTPSLNLRAISPYFKWSDYDLTEEEEKHAERFKNMRIMVELIYKAPIKVLCTGVNVQYRFLKRKRLSLDIYGGMKFFILPGSDFANVHPLQTSKEIWYFNLGLLCQLRLGILSPFVDIGGDGILTIGTELDLHAIHSKPKKRYNLNKVPVYQ